MPMGHSCGAADATSDGRRGHGGSAEPQCDGVVVDEGVRAHVADRVVDELWRGLRSPFLLAGMRGGRHRGWHGGSFAKRVEVVIARRLCTGQYRKIATAEDCSG